LDRIIIIEFELLLTCVEWKSIGIIK